MSFFTLSSSTEHFFVTVPATPWTVKCKELNSVPLAAAAMIIGCMRNGFPTP